MTNLVNYKFIRKLQMHIAPRLSVKAHAAMHGGLTLCFTFKLKKVVCIDRQDAWELDTRCGYWATQKGLVIHGRLCVGKCKGLGLVDDGCEVRVKLLKCLYGLLYSAL